MTGAQEVWDLKVAEERRRERGAKLIAALNRFAENVEGLAQYVKHSDKAVPGMVFLRNYADGLAEAARHLANMVEGGG